MQIQRALERVKKFAGACVDLVAQNPELAEAESAELSCKLDSLHIRMDELCKNPKAANTNPAGDRG